MIKINSWECGKGKTTQWIYPIVHNLIKLDQQILLVVPSITLQDQYSKEFSNISIINISNHAKVVKSIYAALHNREQFICITSAAFLLLNIRDDIKVDYHLVIDEAIDPVRMEKMNFDKSKWPLDFQFKNIFKLKDTSYADALSVEQYDDVTDWHELLVNNPDLDNKTPFMNDSGRWKKLMASNYISFIKLSKHYALCNNAKEQIVIMQMLDIKVLSKWNNVYIAAGSFESTFMYHWIKQSTLQFSIDHKHKFTEHSTQLTFHLPTDEDFSWSKSRKNTNYDILDRYHKYVNNKVDGEKVLVIRNNDEARELVDETKVNHNVHGMNNYIDYAHVSLETALKPDNTLIDFYKNVLDMSSKQITNAFSGYLFYQVIMRTAIRVNKPIDVYMLDLPTFYELLMYFDNVTSTSVIDVRYTPKKIGRPKLLTESQIKENKRDYQRDYMRRRRTSN